MDRELYLPEEWAADEHRCRFAAVPEGTEFATKPPRASVDWTTTKFATGKAGTGTSRWLKQTGPLRQVKLRGLEKVDWLFVFSCAAHNLIRLPKLMAQPKARLTEQCA